MWLGGDCEIWAAELTPVQPCRAWAVAASVTYFVGHTHTRAGGLIACVVVCLPAGGTG
jgi:hypothetical protein